jgi:hypothetical protein
MLTFGFGLQKEFKINHFCGLQGRHCYLVAPLEYTVVADYFAEVNL